MPQLELGQELAVGHKKTFWGPVNDHCLESFET